MGRITSSCKPPFKRMTSWLSSEPSNKSVLIAQTRKKSGAEKSSLFYESSLCSVTYRRKKKKARNTTENSASVGSFISCSRTITDEKFHVQFFCPLVSFHFDIFLSSDYSLGFLVSSSGLWIEAFLSQIFFHNCVQTRLKMDFNVFLYITFRCLMTLTCLLMSFAFQILCDAFRTIITLLLLFLFCFF